MVIGVDICVDKVVDKVKTVDNLGILSTTIVKLLTNCSYVQAQVFRHRQSLGDFVLAVHDGGVVAPTQDPAHLFKGQRQFFS